LKKKGYLVLIVLLLSLGSTSAYAINITLGGTVNITEVLNMMGNRITNVGNPTLSSDVATKAYVDSAPGTDTLASLGCTNGQTVKLIENVWTCGKFIAKNNPVTTIDNTGDVGKYSSIAIGPDGNPIISYYDATNGDLKVIRCGNTSCSNGNTIKTVHSTGDVGKYSSIAIVFDNNTVISYYDATNGDLRVIRCDTLDCNSSATYAIVDSTGDVGQYSSIAIGTDNNPVISFLDATNKDLKVAHCGNPSCSSGNTFFTFPHIGDVGQYSSIAIGTDNNPVISFLDTTYGDLKVAHCGNPSCSSGNTIYTVDSTGDVGQYSSIAIGTDGNPVISYYDFTNGDLKVVKCGNVECDSGNTIYTVDSTGVVGAFTSIAIGTDGNPIISYYEFSFRDLKVAHCGNPSCSSGNTIYTVDSTGIVGEFISIAIGTDNNPVISYHDFTNGDLKVIVDGVVMIFE